MARINVEDSVWLDPRFKLLEKALGSRIMAIGSLVEFWRLAQEYWVRGEQFIPLSVFRAYDLPEAIVECGFALLRDEAIHACGAKEQFAWIVARKTAGRRGGLASGRSRQQKAQTIPIDNKGSKRSRSLKQTPSKTNPLTLTLTPTLTLAQEIQIQGAAALQPAPAQNPVAIWIEEYQRKYGTKYPLLGKDTGTLTNFAKGKLPSTVRALFACYLAINEKLYREQKHPLSLFFRDLPKIASAAQTGVDPSKPAPIDLSFLEDERG